MTKSTSKYKAGENQQAQADANEIILKEVLKNHDKNIGTFIFSFTDQNSFGDFRLDSPFSLF